MRAPSIGEKSGSTTAWRIMGTMTKHVTTRPPRWSLGGAVITAVVASACCIGPLLLALVGVGGAWASGFHSLERFRPMFTLVALGLLVLALFRYYRNFTAGDCCATDCDAPRTSRFRPGGMLLVVLLCAGLLAFPYLAPQIFASTSTSGAATAKGSQVTLQLENLTCASCAVAARKGLTKIEGVTSASVSADPPRAVVTYEPSKVSVARITTAATDLGYPAQAVDDGSN